MLDNLDVAVGTFALEDSSLNLLVSLSPLSGKGAFGLLFFKRMNLLRLRSHILESRTLFLLLDYFSSYLLLSFIASLPTPIVSWKPISLEVCHVLDIFHRILNFLPLKML